MAELGVSQRSKRPGDSAVALARGVGVVASGYCAFSGRWWDNVCLLCSVCAYPIPDRMRQEPSSDAPETDHYS
nr:hypothetical protein Itr_chr14CG12130 [Ipomoea trifida]